MQNKADHDTFQRHDSMRGYFAYELYQKMAKNKDIFLVVGDLGYGMFDKHRKAFPSRSINTGASEQAGVGLCVGLALSGKIPIYYSITPFALYRPYEFIRNYLSHEQIPVIIAGSGRGKDYTHDGFSHHSEEYLQVLNTLNITTYIPDTKQDAVDSLNSAIRTRHPAFISLKR